MEKSVDEYLKVTDKQIKKAKEMTLEEKKSKLDNIMGIIKIGDTVWGLTDDMKVDLVRFRVAGYQVDKDGVFILVDNRHLPSRKVYNADRVFLTEDNALLGQAKTRIKKYETARLTYATLIVAQQEIVDGYNNEG